MSTANNPWVSQPLVPPVELGASADEVSTGIRGPATPQRGVPAPDRADQLDIRDFERTAELFFVGVHGGAGESTLSELAPGWAPTGHAWPRVPGGQARPRVVLVARSNMRGLLAAQHAAKQWGSGLVPFVDVLGLAIVADAPGKLPKPLRDFASVVRGGLPRAWQLPWDEGLRVGQQPNPATAHKDLRAFVTDLTAILHGAPSTNH